jgi:hypothetical protein
MISEMNPESVEEAPKEEAKLKRQGPIHKMERIIYEKM